MADGVFEDRAKPMTFRLEDLCTGAPDPRGRMVKDILWAVDEFKIYKTDKGISPFFSDSAKVAQEQRLAYLEMGEGIAEYNHLIQILRPPLIPLLGTSLPASQRREASLDHFERELARCIAQALLGHIDQAQTNLKGLRKRLRARIENRGRVVHLGINLFLVSIVIVLGHTIAFAYTQHTVLPQGASLPIGIVSVFGFNVTEVSLAMVMGSIGALFSTTVRLQAMVVDPMITPMMHWVYGSQRVIVGVLGAFVIYFGFRSGVINGLFQPLAGPTSTATSAFDPYWLAFVCLLAGFSERLVPNLLDTQATKAMGDDGAKDGPARPQDDGKK